MIGCNCCEVARRPGVIGRCQVDLPTRHRLLHPHSLGQCWDYHLATPTRAAAQHDDGTADPAVTA